MENAQKVSRRVQRILGKYLIWYCIVWRICQASGCLLHTKLSPNRRKVFKHIRRTRKESMRTWRRYIETLRIFSWCAKRHKTEHILVKNGPTIKAWNGMEATEPFARMWQKLVSKIEGKVFKLVKLTFVYCPTCYWFYAVYRQRTVANRTSNHFYE